MRCPRYHIYINIVVMFSPKETSSPCAATHWGTPPSTTPRPPCRTTSRARSASSRSCPLECLDVLSKSKNRAVGKWGIHSVSLTDEMTINHWGMHQSFYSLDLSHTCQNGAIRVLVLFTCFHLFGFFFLSSFLAFMPFCAVGQNWLGAGRKLVKRQACR